MANQGFKKESINTDDKEKKRIFEVYCILSNRRELPKEFDNNFNGFVEFYSKTNELYWNN